MPAISTSVTTSNFSHLQTYFSRTRRVRARERLLPTSGRRSSSGPRDRFISVPFSDGLSSDFFFRSRSRVTSLACINHVLARDRERRGMVVRAVRHARKRDGKRDICKFPLPRRHFKRRAASLGESRSVPGLFFLAPSETSRDAFNASRRRAEVFGSLRGATSHARLCRSSFAIKDVPRTSARIFARA